MQTKVFRRKSVNLKVSESYFETDRLTRWIDGWITMDLIKQVSEMLVAVHDNIF